MSSNFNAGKATHGDALAAAEERFRALFDSAPMATGITRAGIVLYGNPALARLLGRGGADELRGQDARLFLAPDEREKTVGYSRGRAEEGFDSRPTRYETVFLRRDETRVPVRLEVAPMPMPDGEAAVFFAFDLSDEQRDQASISDLLAKEQRAARFAHLMQELSLALSNTSTPDEVASTGLSTCLDAVGAVGGIFVVPRQTPEGVVLSLTHSKGYSTEAVAGWAEMDVSLATPVTRAFSSGEPVWVGDTQNPDDIARFPVLEHSALSGTRALGAVPLRVDDHVLGVLGVSFERPTAFDEEERTFITTLAAACALALERARSGAQTRALARRQGESLALLNTLLDSAPVGFALFDRDHRYVLVNEELARINGLPVDDHIGQRPAEVVPLLGDEVEAFLEQVWQSGAPSPLHSFTIGDFSQNEGFRHCSMALYPVRFGGAGGEMLGVGAVVNEQTERVRGEMERSRLFLQLEVERARFEAILQQMPSAVIIAEAPSGQLMLGNPQVSEVLGQPMLPARSVDDYSTVYRGFHSDGREMAPHEWPMARALRGGEIVRGEEILFERGDGDVGVMRVNAAPIRDARGEISAGVIIFDNVTERARTDRAQRFLAEAGSVLISTQSELAAFGAVAALCAPHMADWCGFVVPEAGGLSCVALSGPGADDGELVARIQQVISSQESLPGAVRDALQARRATLLLPDLLNALGDEETSAPMRALWADLGAHSALFAPLAARGRIVGAMIWLNAASKHVFDQTDATLAEELARRTALSADNARLLQEAQNARDAAQLARDQAQAANSAKDEFLAVVSHELRTPLTPILGWLELLRAPDLPEESRQQAYNVIERNAQAQAQLVNDILDMSRITTGKLRLELKDLALDEIVTRSVETMQAGARDKNIALSTDLQRDLRARADANRLAQVANNLLQNAIKFTPSGGTISVSLRREGTQAHLVVRDTGAGIEAPLIPHVFERFRQGDSSSTRKAGGLGLGLAIVKHIVELHGGRVGVQSEGVGRGATFWVEIPLVERRQETESQARDAGLSGIGRRASDVRLKGIKVLIVDDEPDTREMLAMLLEEAGATVRVAPGGRAALEIAPMFAPSVLVCDIGMPEMDGLELRRELSARGFCAPSIALTAYASPSDEVAALDAGFGRYLAKPVGTKRLVEVIADVVRDAE